MTKTPIALVLCILTSVIAIQAQETSKPKAFSYSHSEKLLTHRQQPWQWTPIEHRGVIECYPDKILVHDTATYEDKTWQVSNRYDTDSRSLALLADKRLFTPWMLEKYGLPETFEVRGDTIVGLVPDEMFGHHSLRLVLEKLDRSMRYTKIRYGRIVETLTSTSIDEYTIPERNGEAPYNRSAAFTPDEFVANKMNSTLTEITFPKHHHRTFVADLGDTLVIMDVPRSEANGQAIELWTRQHYPDHARIYVAGHHHPDYLGGVRAFNRDDVAALIVHQSSVSYLKHILGKEIRTAIEGVDHHRRVGDRTKKTAFEIVHMGEKSMHTDDYLVYVLEQEKMIIENDLLFVKGLDSNHKLSVKRAENLVEFINDHRIGVNRVLQSYPVGEDFITEFTFEDVQRISQNK